MQVVDALIDRYYTPVPTTQTGGGAGRGGGGAGRGGGGTPSEGVPPIPLSPGLFLNMMIGLNNINVARPGVAEPVTHTVVGGGGAGTTGGGGRAGTRSPRMSRSSQDPVIDRLSENAIKNILIPTINIVAGNLRTPQPPVTIGNIHLNFDINLILKIYAYKGFS